jgi:hypothetical protein
MWFPLPISALVMSATPFFSFLRKGILSKLRVGSGSFVYYPFSPSLAQNYWFTNLNCRRSWWCWLRDYLSLHR